MTSQQRSTISQTATTTSTTTTCAVTGASPKESPVVTSVSNFPTAHLPNQTLIPLSMQAGYRPHQAFNHPPHMHTPHMFPPNFNFPHMHPPHMHGPHMHRPHFPHPLHRGMQVPQATTPEPMDYSFTVSKYDSTVAEC